MRTRIAPTPSGFIHLGNAFNFKLIEEIAKKNNATLLLRIDDFDKERAKANYIDDIFDSLSWLRIEIHEGPKERSDFEKNFSLQLKQKEYWQIAHSLLESGKAYACNCSRSQKEKFNAKGAYLGSCRNKALKFYEGMSAIRLKCPEDSREVWQESLQDFVIWTKENSAAYQLISVIEDSRTKIDAIIRGQDLEDSSRAQAFLAKCLAGDFAETFAKIKFIHHDLVLDPKNPQKKYSKSEGSHSLKNMIQAGYTYTHFLSDFEYFKINNCKNII